MKDNIHMSPEGLEENIELEIQFRITLTQGEKYRLYLRTTDTDWAPSPKCYNTLAEATIELTQRMAHMGTTATAVQNIMRVLDELTRKGAEQ